MQRRDYTFGVRMNERERQLLEALAEHLERNQSDTVRFLIRKTAREEEISSAGGDDGKPADGGRV